MMSLQPMIDRNNATLVFLQQQDFANATLSSVAALALLQELQRTSPDIFSADGGVSSPLDCMDQCMLLSDIKPDALHDDITPFVFDLGIVIPSTPAINYDVVTSLLVYNSALAHQLYAQQLQDKVTSREYLQRSKHLYELALGAYSDVDHNVLFQFASMNNIAVIELETGNVALSRQYFEDLMSTLMLLSGRGCSSRRCYLVGFLRNDPFKVAAAAASA